MSKNEKVKVTIKCKQVMHYDQQIEISKEDFDKIKDIDFGDVHLIRDRIQYSIIEGLINYMDILKSDDEFLDVQVIEGWE